MSKNNKVNPGQYTQAGRLSPDDAARERQAAAAVGSSRSGSGQKATRTRPAKKQADSGRASGASKASVAH